MKHTMKFGYSAPNLPRDCERWLCQRTKSKLVLHVARHGWTLRASTSTKETAEATKEPAPPRTWPTSARRSTSLSHQPSKHHLAIGHLLQERSICLSHEQETSTTSGLATFCKERSTCLSHRPRDQHHLGLGYLYARTLNLPLAPTKKTAPPRAWPSSAGGLNSPLAPTWCQRPPSETRQDLQKQEKRIVLTARETFTERYLTTTAPAAGRHCGTYANGLRWNCL